MSLRWNAVLCVSIIFIAIAFVAGVLFLAGWPGRLTAQAPIGKPSPAANSNVLSKPTKVLSLAGSPGQVPAKKITPETKVLPKPADIEPLQETTGMQPSEPNMTVIAKAFGNLSYSNNNVEVVVTNPPLLIDLTVIPKIVTDTKWFVNRSLTKNEETVQVSGVSPYSFANVSVIDKETSRIVAQEGFGRDGSIYETRSIKVYAPGKYLVQIYGNEVAVKALVSMRTLS